MIERISDFFYRHDVLGCVLYVLAGFAGGFAIVLLVVGIFHA